MNRIEACFHRLRALEQPAFVAYITAGDPSCCHTLDLVLGLVRAGADIIELGIPFSDPLADGQVNQLAAQRALEAGTTTEDVFRIVESVRKESEVPLVLFTYYNPMYRYGDRAFIARAIEAGADGVLLLDLPPEECQELDFGTLKRIQLIAPTTPYERIRRLAALADGFIYYVSREGVTGMQRTLASDLRERVALIRGEARCPICIGFGISNPEQAAQAAALGDGVVVGSALVNFIAENRDLVSDLGGALETFARPFAEAIHGVRLRSG
ncbi:MAG: tryptophan synthase subunit alpha [Methylacidiphilales bacterium]|nr:tryptophan synthase subunit alpha [Candidatus Methylacidiphilales bacterium]MDW8350095.1 tryptophan synthase subunit alpha [Verrucomicrobiae bacterium]